MVDPELDELRREFLAEADEKVREIEANAADHSPASMERLAHLAHQLKGSGGSYGFQVISDEAAALERAVEELEGGQDAGAIATRIAQHAANLRGEIDRRARELARY
jgi:HPt (histidine-containing phosphotransfer) domain-containing protein